MPAETQGSGLAAMLGSARANARSTAAPSTAHGATSPGAGDGAAHEDHGSLHTARAFGLCADVTGDQAFLRDEAWPVLSGVADWIVSRVTRTPRGYEFLRSMGPAEVPHPPDNDAFTIMAALKVSSSFFRATSRE